MSLDSGPSPHRAAGPSARFLLAIYLPTLLVVAAVGLVSAATGIPSGSFTKDPAEVARAPIYVGCVSNLGILLWAAAVVPALLAAGVLPRRSDTAEQRRFLFWSAALTLMLALDDILMIHDGVAQQLFNVRDQAVLLAYFLAAAAYAVRFRGELGRSDRLLLAALVILTVVSMTLDQWHVFVVIFGRPIVPKSHLIEDGTKLLAQATWMGYLLRRAAGALTAQMRT